MRALTGTPLGRAALLLAATDVLHALDHTRQGRDLAADVYGAGIAGWIALAVLLVLVARGHRLAAPYAAAVGLSVAVGFVAVHVAPHWSAFSDPYPDAGVDALSWALVAIPVLAGLNLTAQALRAERGMRAAGVASLVAVAIGAGAGAGLAGLGGAGSAEARAFRDCGAIRFSGVSTHVGVLRGTT